MIKTKPQVAVCATCPWLVQNQGKPHPSGWYKLANLKRLWNGLRTGKAPGMICHSTDPASVEYGSTKTVPGTTKPRECAGAIILCIRHANEAGATYNFKDYQARHPYPLTRTGLRCLVGRALDPFNSIPEVHDNPDVQLPWEQRNKLKKDQ